MRAALCMHGGWCVQLYSQPQYFTTCIFLNRMHYVVVMKKKYIETEESFIFIFLDGVQSRKLILNTICPWSRDYNPYLGFPLAKEILIHAHMVTRSRASPDYVSPVHISCYQLTC